MLCPVNFPVPPNLCAAERGITRHTLSALDHISTPRQFPFASGTLGQEAGAFPENPSSVSDNSSGRVDAMSDVITEMQGAVRHLAGPRQYGETVERAIERAAKLASLSYRSAKAFWYGERQNPRERDVSLVREALRALEPMSADVARFASDQEMRAHDEIRALRARLEALEHYLAEPRAQPVGAGHLPLRRGAGVSVREGRAE